MKERPILFSTPMVKAEIEDQKTMTRRTKGLEAIESEYQYKGLLNETPNKHIFARFFRGIWVETYHASCPYGQPGDVLWVREKFRFEEAFDYDGEHYPAQCWYYASTPEKIECIDGVINDRDLYKWKPSIHMPKEAARIWLQITSIKAERLHDISDEDIKAEGVRIPVNGLGTGRVLLAIGEKNTAIDFLPKGCLAPDAPKLTQSQLLHAFWAELWCKINGRESYDKNPWVWAIRFKVLSTTGKPAEL